MLVATLTVTMAMAQSMTDEQLIKYVQAEKEKGTSQNVILRNLVAKGVTPEQVRRVRRKVEAEQQQLGASDLTGKTGGTTQSRLRNQRQRELDERQKRQGQMVRSQMEEQEWRYKNRKQRIQDLESETDFFDLDSLQYYADRLPKDQQVFGREIFNQPYLSFEPNQNIATPTNYRLGAGDKVIIDIWGASQLTIEETISPDGTITIDNVGPVQLAGLTVSQAKQRLRSRIGQFYSDCEVSLALGENRSINVQVLGEVKMPGSYTMSSLSSAFNALYAAGGIGDIGTVRNIKVYRGGRQLATIDVYEFLLHGNSTGNVRLQDDDVIIVGPYECLVEVRGKVKRPMFYEMKPTESVAQVVNYSGGFSGDAYTKNVRLVRKQGMEYTMHTIGEFDMGNFKIADGDSLYIDSVIPRFSNMAEVRGAVMHPGQFQMDGSVQSVRDLIRLAEGLREDAFTQRAVMHRMKDDLSLEMISVDLEGIMAGTSPDVPLKKGDVLFIPSKEEMKGEQTLTIGGEVNYPGKYKFAENTTIKDLILMAGGLTRTASMAKVDVFRPIYEPKALLKESRQARHYSFTLKDGFELEDTMFVLQPFDEVQVRRSPITPNQQNVTVTGNVNFEGEYAMTSKEFRLSDLVKMAGGLDSLAYPKGAQLIRTMTDIERQQQEQSLRKAQIRLYEQSMDEDKNYNLALADSLLEMKMDMGTSYNVGINLEEAIKHPGGVDDILLRENDRLVVPQYSNTIKISGEVMYPISINYKEGEGIQYYIKRAGGYTQNAAKRGAYAIYMNGTVNQLGKRTRSKNIQPGCEIVVPTKKKRQGLSAAEIMMLGTSAVSLSTMIVTLINNLK